MSFLEASCRSDKYAHHLAEDRRKLCVHGQMDLGSVGGPTKPLGPIFVHPEFTLEIDLAR